MGFQNDARFLNFVPGLSPYTNPLTATIAQGQQQAKEQKRALGAQAEAQRNAESLAAQQIRQNAEAIRRANMKKPDVGAMLAAASQTSGASSTVLTGPGGVDPASLKLGKTSTLGA